MAASSSSSSSNRVVNTSTPPNPRPPSSYGYRRSHNHHPQLYLPLSHHGLPRAPTSPSSSFSSRSNRYEALGNPRPASSSTALAKHQRSASITSFASSAASTFSSTTTTASDGSQQRAASFFSYDAPHSPPMTPFSPSAFPSEASTPIVPSPALPMQMATSADDRESQRCANCGHIGPGRSGSAALVTDAQQLQQQRSRSVERASIPVRRRASSRSVTFGIDVDVPVGEVLTSSTTQDAGRKSEERSRSRLGSVKEAGVRERGSGSTAGEAGNGGFPAETFTSQQQLRASPTMASSTSSSSFSRMGKRIKAALGGPKKSGTAGADAGATTVASARRREKERKRDRDRETMPAEVEEVGGVHWTEM